MAANQGAAKTSNSDSLFSSGPRNGCWLMYCCTLAGSVPFCGSTEPGTLARARRKSSTNAVRMAVSCRQHQRSQPNIPNGFATCAAAWSGLSGGASPGMPPTAATPPLPVGSATPVMRVSVTRSPPRLGSGW